MKIIERKHPKLQITILVHILQEPFFKMHLRREVENPRFKLNPSLQRRYLKRNNNNNNNNKNNNNNNNNNNNKFKHHLI